MMTLTRLFVTALFAPILLAICGSAPQPAFARGACLAPQAVCDTRDSVFLIKSFDPFGSAVRIGADLLVTNRHVVADEETVKIETNDGVVEGSVVPTRFAGDLVLIRASLPDGPVIASRDEPVTPSDRLHTVGYDLGQRGIRVYVDGNILALPAPGFPLARLHHTAHTQPGNSGGAVVDELGRLVGIATSGGAGVFEAIPVASIQSLKESSDPDHKQASRTIGATYRNCILATEAAARTRGALPAKLTARLTEFCPASGNRQLIDLAAQALGRSRNFPASRALFEQALDIDPNAINTRLGLVVSLMYARMAADALTHIRQLLAIVPANLTVHRMAIQAGKVQNDKALVATALDAIKRYNPRGLEAAERFLSQPARTRQIERVRPGSQEKKADPAASD